FRSESRGVELDRTYQLNIGGNMDFKNMLERERLESKKVSKTQAVTSNLDGPLAGKKEDRNVHIGPSDYVAWLDDRKWAYVRLEGRAFGEVPLNLEYKLEVWDSPNSAGIIIDALRAAKIARDRGVGGPITSAASYFMKSPPQQLEDSAARARVEAFISGDIERRGPATAPLTCPGTGRRRRRARWGRPAHYRPGPAFYRTGSLSWRPPWPAGRPRPRARGGRCRRPPSPSTGRRAHGCPPNAPPRHCRRCS